MITTTDSRLIGNKWRRQVSGSQIRRGCIFCGGTIARYEKHDKNFTRKVYAHITCGLVQLNSLPQQTWVGRRVLHPMEQWSNNPNWNIDRPDQGIIVDWELDDRWGLSQYEVYFAVDGWDGFALHYKSTNLWTRVW